MADTIDELDSHYVPGCYGGAGDPGVVFSQVKDFCLLQLAVWTDTVSTVGAAGAGVLGFSEAPGPGEAATGDNGAMLRIEPLKWWLLAEGSAAFASPVIAPHECCILDLSHSRTWLKISGEKAAVLLNHFLPIDLRERSFPVDSVASSAFHHTGVTLWRSEGEFNLLLARSFAVSLWQLLHESATQYGCEVV